MIDSERRMYCLLKMVKGFVVLVPGSWHCLAEEGPIRP